MAIAQQLKPSGYAKRNVFSEQVIDLLRDDKIVIMSNEAHIHLNGYVNKLNF